MPGQTDSSLLQADLTNSPSRLQLLAEQRHSFAIGVYVEDSDHIPVDITGCTITMTAVFPPHKGGGVAISKVADLVDGVAGHAQLNLQAADLDLAAAQYEFAVSLLTPFGFSSPVAKGFLEVASNPDPGYVDEEYTDLGPPGSITFTIGTNYVVGVQVNHLASPTSVPGAPGLPGAPGAPGPPGPPGASGQTGQPHNGSILGFPGPPDTTTVASTPFPALWTPGDLDIRALIAPKAWALGTSQAIIGVTDNASTGTSGANSFLLQLSVAGKITFFFSPLGYNFSSLASLVANPASFVNGQPVWIRVTYRYNTGSAGTVSFYWSAANDGVNWTLLDTRNNAAGILPPFKSTKPIQVGVRDGGVNPFSGLVYAAEVRHGIDGAVKAALDFRGQWTGTGSAGNVWTISGKPYWYVPPSVPGASGASVIRSVKDYGANGDDLTGAVNTPAIQQALDELPAGGTLLFPDAGGALNRYRVNATLLTPKNGPYHLTGPAIPTNAWWSGATLEAAPGSNLVAIMAGRSWYTNGADGGKQPPAGTFSNLFFYGGGFSEEDGGKHDKTIETTANTQYCLVAHGSNVKIQNCTFESANVDGLLIAGSIGRDGKSPVGETHEMWISSCGIRYCGRDGFHANAGAQDGYISTTKVQYAGRHAFATDNGASAWVFDHCHPSRCGSDFFHIGAQWQCMINHCYLDALGDFMDGKVTPWRAAGTVRYGIWTAGGDDLCIHMDHNFGQTESTGNQKDPVVMMRLKGWVVATNNHLRYQRTDSSVAVIEDVGSTLWSVISGNVAHMPAAPAGTLNLVPDPSNEAGSWYSGSKSNWPGVVDTTVFDSRTQSIKTTRAPVSLTLNNLSVVYLTPEDVDDPRAVPVQVGDVLSMTLRVRCNQATWRARIQVNFADAAGVVLGGQPSSAYLTFNDQSWHTLSLANVVVPAGAAYIQMQGNIAMPNGTFPVGGEICWFDSAIMNPGAAPIAYFDGYSPGAIWLGDPDASASQIL